MKILKKKRIKILRIISTLNPKYGGPSRATIDSSLMLKKKGIDVDILTCDDPKDVFFRTKKIKIINKGPSLLGTYWFSLKLFFWLIKNKDKYDSFILHGIWEFKNLVARFFVRKKYYVFLHGQLDPFFSKNFFKMIKKKIYWLLVEESNLLHSKSVLLTSKGELDTLKKTYVNTRKISKKFVNYGILKPKLNKKKIKKLFFIKFSKIKNKNFYLFLSRFHEKKGCEIIIKSIKKLGDKFNDLVLMVGPLQNSVYETKIKNLIKIYHLENKIIISDALYGDLKWAAILESKAMILPSHGENFGVTLVESLCLGKPVLTTNKVNISKDILNFNAGFISNDNTNSFVKILSRYDSLSQKQLQLMSKNAYKCFKLKFDLTSNINLLKDLINK